MSAPFSKRRLHHATPAWVSAGAVFHIRIRCDREWRAKLTAETPGRALLESACFYHDTLRWHCRLFLLMPDHLHALLAFPEIESMSRVLKDWKTYQSRFGGLAWQDGYFDHRLRNAGEVEMKANYIRNNPVVKGLCDRAEAWPWVVERAEATPD